MTKGERRERKFRYIKEEIHTHKPVYNAVHTPLPTF